MRSHTHRAQLCSNRWSSLWSSAGWVLLQLRASCRCLPAYHFRQHASWLLSRIMCNPHGRAVRWSQGASKSHPDWWQNGGAEIKRLQIPSANSSSSRLVCCFWAFYFYSGDQTHYCLYVPSLNDSIYRVATFTVECRKDVTSNGVILNCSERT